MLLGIPMGMGMGMGIGIGIGIGMDMGTGIGIGMAVVLFWGTVMVRFSIRGSVRFGLGPMIRVRIMVRFRLCAPCAVHCTVIQALRPELCPAS